MAMALASNLVWDLSCVIITYNRTHYVQLQPDRPINLTDKILHITHFILPELVDKIQKKLPKGFHAHLSHHYSYGCVNNTPNHA